MIGCMQVYVCVCICMYEPQIAGGNEFDPHSKVCYDCLYVRVCMCVYMYV
jgi:hypothetical protein